MIIARAILGLVQGPLFPCIGAFAAHWYPADQRARLCSIHYIGISAGSAIAIYISGILIYSTNRWDVVYYFFAVITVVWWILIVRK